MRKIVANLFISLDGVAESPDTFVFPYFNDEVAAAVQSAMASADTVLMGRRLYEEWSAYWSDKTAADDAFAPYINESPKLVASTTLTNVEWRNTRLLGADTAAQLRGLKRQDGKDIAVNGSMTLVRWLLQEGLLDELGLLVFPVVVGHGRRLFDGSAHSLPLTLVSARTFANGVLSLVYAPARG